MGLSTPRLLEATVRMICCMSPNLQGTYLDIGAGHGDLIQLVRDDFEVTASACDYTDSLMQLQDVAVDIADLNVQKLPYADGSFNLVTCTEVIEHLENYHFTLREVFRVLKPGGIFVLSTPNILNLKSRIRFLFFGFYNLFGPMHVGESRLYSSDAHITPVSYFYIVHSLCDAGFDDITVAVDKWQRSSTVWLSLLWFPIRAYSLLALRRERRKYKTVDRRNLPFVKKINSVDLLLGRTVVIGCRKTTTTSKPG